MDTTLQKLIKLYSLMRIEKLLSIDLETAFSHVIKILACITIVILNAFGVELIL